MKYLIDWKSLISDLIEKMGITQTEFGELCQVRNQLVSKWCSGKRSPGKTKQIIILQQFQKHLPDLNDYKKLNYNVDPKIIEDAKLMAGFLNIPEDILQFSIFVFNQPAELRKEMIKMTDYYFEIENNKYD